MAEIKDMIAQIGAMLTKKEEKPFSYEELAAMLKTSPDALKTFEDAYKKQVLDSGHWPRTSYSGIPLLSRLCSTRGCRLRGT